MKWYEKQKKIFEQNNPVENTNIQETTEEKNIIDSVEDNKDAYVGVASQEKNDALLDSMVDEIILEPIDKEIEEKPAETDFTTARTSVLQEGIIVNGTITCDHNLTIFGTINGDIVCNGKVIIYGNVKGNLDCKTLELENAQLVGDVTCKEEILLQENSTLNGNIKAITFISKGQLNGDATISDCSTFAASSIMIGNLETNVIEIAKGSVINGIIRITKAITV